MNETYYYNGDTAIPKKMSLTTDTTPEKCF